MVEVTDWRKAFRTTTLVCAAIIASLFLYALIVEILRSRLGFFSGLARPSQARPLLFIFYGLAIVAVLLTRILNRSLMKGMESDPLEERILRLSRASVITAVLAELPALVGFVLFLLIGSSRDFYLLWFGSLVLEFIFFPRLRTWQQILGEQLPGESG
ncbi:MAG: hypothetical protein QHH14_01740 [Clostridiales bacterium]|nr:hypothetical protein [Clostridiales bacterium]